jgi:hypothetical protein
MIGARTRRMARFTFTVALGMALLGAAALALLAVTPPRMVARQILLTVSDDALFAPAETERTRYAVHKLVGMYLEYTIAGKMARTAAARTDLHDDVARIAFVLGRANARMLSAAEIPHASQDWPVLVSGVGYCDQINGAVARILAHSFPHAQLFALRDPSTGTSPHTIGRVWSNERNEWLYFDGFYAQVVFRKLPAGGVEVLSNADADRGLGAGVLGVYAYPGWVMSEYPPTFPAFLASSIGKRWHPWEAPPLSPQTASAPVAQAAPVAAVPPIAATLAPPPDEAASHRVAKTYVQARADDLFGDPEQAKKRYRAVAAATGELDPRVKILQAAALRFGRP